MSYEKIIIKLLIFLVFILFILLREMYIYKILSIAIPLTMSFLFVVFSSFTIKHTSSFFSIMRVFIFSVLYTVSFVYVFIGCKIDGLAYSELNYMGTFSANIIIFLIVSLGLKFLYGKVYSPYFKYYILCYGVITLTFILLYIISGALTFDDILTTFFILAIQLLFLFGFIS